MFDQFKASLLNKIIDLYNIYSIIIGYFQNLYLFKLFCFCILKYIFLYQHILMTVIVYSTKNNHFLFQNKQKIVQTLLKWLFWTSII